MHNLLEKLRVDLLSYREIVDQLLSTAFAESRDWQKLFFEILICTSQLYLDYLLVIKTLPDLQSLASKEARFDLIPADIVREKSLRTRLKQRLTSGSWPGFIPQNSFSDITGLSNLRDYIDIFTLHLSEIYEESFRVEACTKELLETHSSSALAQLIVGLRHLGQEHIGFVFQALDWAADEDSWEESITTPKES